jgi:hypothetical protein
MKKSVTKSAILIIRKKRKKRIRRKERKSQRQHSRKKLKMQELREALISGALTSSRQWFSGTSAQEIQRYQPPNQLCISATYLPACALRKIGVG